MSILFLTPVEVVSHRAAIYIYIFGWLALFSFRLTSNVLLSGAPNENIVQNHLNIALLNVF